MYWKNILANEKNSDNSSTTRDVEFRISLSSEDINKIEGKIRNDDGDGHITKMTFEATGKKSQLTEDRIMRTTEYMHKDIPDGTEICLLKYLYQLKNGIRSYKTRK